MYTNPISEDVFEDEEVDVSVIWYITLLVETVRGATGTVIVKYREQIEHVLDLILKIRSKDAFHVNFINQNNNYFNAFL